MREASGMVAVEVLAGGRVVVLAGVMGVDAVMVPEVDMAVVMVMVEMVMVTQILVLLMTVV